MIAAAVNLPVAWLFAWASKPHLSDMHSHPAWDTRRVVEHEGWTLYTQSRIGIVRSMARRPYTNCVATAVPAGAFPRWCSIRELPALQRPPWHEEGIIAGLSDWAYGWPCVSMWHVFAGERGVWPESDSAYLWNMHLPLKIVWFGFLINTVVYAAAILGLVAVPRSLRSFLRIRAGRCPRCGYPAGAASACSECGAQQDIRTSDNGPL